MNEFEAIKLAAHKEKRAEQAEKGKEIREKVEKVSHARKNLVVADAEAQEVLEKYKREKARIKAVKGEFDALLQDDSVREYMEKRGIRTIDDYAQMGEAEKSDLSKKYEESKAKLAELRADLRGEVKERAEAKDELLGELQKNKPEHKLRTKKGLVKEAEREESALYRDKIEAFVDGMLAGYETKLEKYLDDAYKTKNTPVNFITENDLVKLSEYGWGSTHLAEDMFIKKLRKLADEVVEKWWPTLDETLQERYSLKSCQEFLQEVISKKGNAARKGVNEMDEALRREKNADKLEKMTVEIEQITTDLAVKIEINPYKHLVETFVRRGSDFLVNLKVLDKEATIGKYFNMTYEGATGRFGVMDQESLENKVTLVEADQATLREEQNRLNGKRRDFNNRNFLYKAFNGDVEKAINRKLRDGRESTKVLENCHDLLQALRDFIQKMSDLEKRNDISVHYDLHTNGAADTKAKYLEQLKKLLS